MFLDRLKTVTCDRASKIVGIDSHRLVKAMHTWTKTNGARGLAFVILPGNKKPRIRLCAIDDWLSQLEEDARYVH